MAQSLEVGGGDGRGGLVAVLVVGLRALTGDEEGTFGVTGDGTTGSVTDTTVTAANLSPMEFSFSSAPAPVGVMELARGSASADRILPWHDGFIWLGYGNLAAQSQAFSSAMVSSDGISWEAVPNFEIPSEGFVQDVSSDGEHLALMVTGTEFDASGDGTPTMRQTATIMTTSDLVNWTTATLTAEPPAVDHPDWVFIEDLPTFESLATTPEGWRVEYGFVVGTDLEAALPEGFSFGQSGGDFDSDGVVVMDHSTERARRLPWADIGIDPDGPEGVWLGRHIVITAFIGDWNGSSELVAVGIDPFTTRTMAATDAGHVSQLLLFQRFSGEISVSWRFSPDGVDWSVIDVPFGPIRFAPAWYVVDGGMIVFLGSDNDPRLWRGEPDGTGWTPVPFPDDLQIAPQQGMSLLRDGRGTRIRATTTDGSSVLVVSSDGYTWMIVPDEKDQPTQTTINGNLFTIHVGSQIRTYNFG